MIEAVSLAAAAVIVVTNAASLLILASVRIREIGGRK
jgi:hypothetical protein